MKLNYSLKAAAIAIVASLIYFSSLKFVPLIEVPNLKFQDLFFNLRYLAFPSNPLKDQILLISVDDESLKKMKAKWPFNRRVYADVLKKLEGKEPAVVAFDFVFSGQGEAIDDFILSESFKKTGNVIVASFVDQDGTFITSQKEILEAAKASGVVNKVLDPDHTVRSSYLTYQDAEGKHISWPWEVELAKYLIKVPSEKIQMSEKGLLFDRSLIPFSEVDEKKIRINYRLKLSEVNQIPFWKAHELGMTKKTVSKKIVIFAATSHLLHDYYQTPFGLMPGIMININLLSNLLAWDFLKEIPIWLDIPLFFICSILAAYAALRARVLKGLILFILLLVVVIGFSFLLFLMGFLVNTFSYLFCAIGIFLAVAFFRYSRTFLENTKLEKKVSTDPLTGLYNRRALEPHLDSMFEEKSNQKTSRKTDALNEISVLMIDIDDFKNINDTHGHQFGDDVIKNVAFAIKENIRAEDFAARYGGEEFCVVLNASKDEAFEIAEKIRKAVELQPMSYVNKLMNFTISVGLASAKYHEISNAKALIRAADEALYMAKRSGKNKVSLYIPKKKES